MKNKFLFTAILTALLSVQIFSQQTTPTPVLYSEKTLENMEKIQQAALLSNYAYDKTAYMTNNIGARLSGSPQAERAVEYVADEMRKLGLEVQLQKLSVPHWVRGEEKGELVEFEGMAKNKDKFEWLAENEFSLKIGNAGAVKLNLNDKDLGSLGKNGEVINKTFTKDKIN